MEDGKMIKQRISTELQIRQCFERYYKCRSTGGTGYKHFLSARDWFSEYQLIRDVYEYGGKTPAVLKWYMFLFNFR